MTSGQYSFGRRSYRGRIHRMQGWGDVKKLLILKKIICPPAVYIMNAALKYADYLSGFLRTHLRFPETDVQRRQNNVHVHVLYCIKRNAYLRTREKCRSCNSEASAFYLHFCYVLNCLEMFYIMTIKIIHVLDKKLYSTLPPSAQVYKWGPLEKSNKNAGCNPVMD